TLTRPDFTQVYRFAVTSHAERLGRQIYRHPARDRVRDDQRWRREIVRPNLLLDAPFEIPVAAQDGGDHEVTAVDFAGHIIGQRTAVADAGRTPVPHKAEAEPIQILLQS